MPFGHGQIDCTCCWREVVGTWSQPQHQKVVYVHHAKLSCWYFKSNSNHLEQEQKTLSDNWGLKVGWKTGKIGRRCSAGQIPGVLSLHIHSLDSYSKQRLLGVIFKKFSEAVSQIKSKNVSYQTKKQSFEDHPVCNQESCKEGLPLPSSAQHTPFVKERNRLLWASTEETFWCHM